MKQTWMPLLICGVLAHVTCAQASEALHRIDRVRNPGTAFQTTVRITAYAGDSRKSEMLVRLLARPEGASGYRNILYVLEPGRDSGKVFLKTDEEMWFHDPGSKSTVRISPEQRLLGQVSNGDALAANFADDYKVAGEADEAITDGEKNQVDTTRLTLEGVGRGALYRKVVMWARKGSGEPLKARFYSATGFLLKTVFYRKYRPILGASRPSETVLIDGVDKDSVTVMQYTDFKERNLPESWFKSSSLRDIHPD